MVLPLQILVDTSAVPDVVFTADEATTDADAGVTVTITDLAGTAIVTAAATDHVGDAGSGRYEYDGLDPFDAPDLLTLAWSGLFSGKAQTLRTQVEIVGGYAFTIADLRASDGIPGGGTARPLSNSTTWPSETLRLARQAAEAEAARILGFSLIPKADSERLVVRSGLLQPGMAEVRAVRSAVLISSGEELDVDSWTIEGSRSQFLRAPLAERAAVRVVYEHGLDRAPLELSQACMARARHACERIATALPATTERYIVTDTGTFSVALPGVRSTGNAHVDGIYLAASVRGL